MQARHKVKQETLATASKCLTESLCCFDPISELGVFDPSWYSSLANHMNQDCTANCGDTINV